MEVAASVIAVVQLSDRIVSLCGQYATDVKGAREDILRMSKEVQYLRDAIESARQLLERGPAEDTIRKLEPCIQECESQLSKLTDRLNPGHGRNLMKRVGLRALTWPLRSKDVDKAVDALERRKTTILLALSVDQSARAQTSEQNQLIEKLPFAEGAGFDSTLWEQKPTCLQDTRVDLLQRIQQWSVEPYAADIFWLRGMAGTGKSAVARTVAKTFAAEKRLGASFFFSRGQGDLSNAAKFSTTVASQLARGTTSLADHIAAAVSADPQITQRGIYDQWKHLVIRPLSEVKKDSKVPQYLFLVVDALDECDGRGGGEEPSSDIQLVLQLLSELNKSQNALQLRVFLTSRPEIQICRGFRQMPKEIHRDFSLHDIEDTITHQDIRRYLSHELNVFRIQHDIPTGWPKQEEIDGLTKSANTIFIYAATVCRFLHSCRIQPPADRLAPLLLSKPTAHSPSKQLDEIYTQVLRVAIVGSSDPEESKEPTRQFRSICGPLILLYNMLNPSSLARLLALREELVKTVLSSLQAIVDFPEDHTTPVQLLHPSLRDFLLDEQRCFDSTFWIDQKLWHRELFSNCLRVMSEHLRKDICSLSHPGILATDVGRRQVDMAIPYHVQYACRYWVSHLECCDSSPDSFEMIHEFFMNRFLYWLEALSLLGLMSEAVLLVERLRVFLSIRGDNDPQLVPLMFDAKRFVLKHRSIIETAPLQTYSSAMVFAPSNSIVRQIYEKEMPSWIISSPHVERDWNPSLQSLEGHSSSVIAVAFSPDGKLVASASDDNTVRLWDTTSSSELQNITAPGVSTLTFNSDGSCLSTNWGNIAVDSSLERREMIKRHAVKHLFVEDNWVKVGGQRLLWLPHECRPTCMASQGDLLALGQSSGRVSFIKIGKL